MIWKPVTRVYDIAVFPNNAVQRQSGKLFVEPSMTLLLDPLISAKNRVAWAALIHATRIDSCNVALEEPRLRLLKLGKVHTRRARWKRFLAYMSYVIPILRAASQSRFSYIFYPGNVGTIAAICCILTGKPYGLYLRGDYRSAAPRGSRFANEWILRSAQFIICTGEHLMQSARIHNGNVSLVTPMSRLLTTTPPRRNGCDNEKSLTVLFVGRIVEAKGVFDLLEAFERVLSSCDLELRLVYVGDGKDRSKLEELISTRELENAVECKGLVSDTAFLAEIYRSSRVFCLPTYSEGFPRVLYEAMHFKLAIVTSSLPQIRAVLTPDSEAIMFQPMSIDSLAVALSNVIVSPSRRRSISSAGFLKLERLRAHWPEKSHGHQILEHLGRHSLGTLR